MFGLPKLHKSKKRLCFGTVFFCVILSS
ncbi:hypothetical protein DWZ54_02360 [Mitsuokella sp. AF33-22]|nr:hypothetical protein DWZ54_02360 [Mitsuokella sp. AF33-22]